MANASTHLTNWTTYQAAWAAIPEAERRRLLDDSVAADCIYTDPQSVSHGHDELIKKMKDTQHNFPGARFRNDRFVDHHDQAISNWTMFDGEEKAIFVGTSHARFGRDGRLSDMIGFFEPVA